MLNLYIKPYCPYCARVMAANETIKAPIHYRDITSDPEIRDQLMTKGGKSQVPFLEDIDRNVTMYESEDIIAYLQTYYGEGAAPDVSAE